MSANVWNVVFPYQLLVDLPYIRQILIKVLQFYRFKNLVAASVIPRRQSSSGQMASTVLNAEASVSPVACYGKSSDFGQVLDFIQAMITNDTLREEFDIPHLVVVGRQNMAKTTLINRLIGRYLLPMRRAETATHLQALTTSPILLNLRHGPCSRVEVKCGNVHQKADDPTDTLVEDFLKKVAGQLPKEEGTPISRVPIDVTLAGPDLTTLTLVDLPGVHFANDNQRMNHVTQELVLEYIKKNKRSIIVIVSEVGDPTGDSAINLVMQRAPDYRNRTICVLTKPDKLRETDDLGRKVALNKSSFTLEENRFIVMRGKDGTDPKEKDWDAEMTRVKEREWFRSHQMYRDILHLCGVDRLMVTMISLLAERLVTDIPVLVAQMKNRKDEVEDELKKLAETEVPESQEGKGALVMRLKQQLIDKLQTMLFKNTTDSVGGEGVRELFKSFQTKILSVDPLKDRSDQDIWKLLQKLEGVGAPLGDSSENTLLLELLLYEKFNTTLGPSALPSPVDVLLPICKQLVIAVEKKLKSIVAEAIEECLATFPDLKLAVKTCNIGHIFEAKRSETETFIEQFVQMQKKSVDSVAVKIPLPQEITQWEGYVVTPGASPFKQRSVACEYTAHPIMTSQLMSHLKHLSQQVYPKGLLDKIGETSVKGNYRDNALIKNTKKNVAQCFNVIKMNVADAIPRCIQHFFVEQLVKGLDQTLKVNEMVEHVKEKQEVREQRKRCRAQVQALKYALPLTDEVIKKLLSMRKVAA